MSRARCLAYALVAWAAIATAAPVAAKSRHALLIANQAYKPTVGRLENPANDVALIQSALERTGFLSTHIRVVRDADRGAILRAVLDYATALARAGDDAIGLFYYSGHGVANPQDKRNYLIPVNVARLDAYVWTEAVSLSKIVDTLSDRAPNAAHFVVFDACRNVLRLPVRGTKGFVPVSEKRGMLIAFSTDPGATASDDGQRSGPYAEALAAEILRPGQSHLDLFQNVRERVWTKTRAQVPWTRDGLLRRVYLSDRIVLPSAGKQAQPAGRQPARGNARAPQSLESAAPACTVIGRNIPRRIKLAVGQRFCDKSGRNEATVVKIANRLVIFNDNGVRKSCGQGELCGFNWPSVVPMFRITARADLVKGITPSGAMLPR